MDLNSQAIEIKGLSFSYPEEATPVLHTFDLEIRNGERFGLFGPNGAGKTTLLSCMTGLLGYKQGSIRIFGEELQAQPQKIKQVIGFVPQDFAFYHELTVIENLNFFGALYGIESPVLKERITDLVNILELENSRHKQLRHLSGGLKRRVNLAIGVLHKPRILFLDEPTVGVDVSTRRSIVSFLKNISDSGTTLVYTSHQLNEAEEICDVVALMNNGKILAHNSLPALLSENKCNTLEELFVSLTERSLV
jgi:ABC-2 type transport system ATP-binding protein